MGFGGCRVGRLSWVDLRVRPLLVPSACFVLGRWVSGENTAWVWPLLIAAASGFVACFWAHARVGALLCALLGFGVLGAGLATVQRARTTVPTAAFATGKPVVLEGRLVTVDHVNGDTRLRLEVARVNPDGADAPAQFLAQLRAGGHSPFHPGQHVRLRARLKADEGPDNPGEADFGRAWRDRGQRFRGSFEPASVLALSEPSAWALWRASAVARLRTDVERLAPDAASANLFLTLAAGERAGLGPELENAFSRSGLAHVLSVSGMHVAVLALALMRVLRFVLVRLSPWARRMDVQRLAAPLAVPCVWAYVVFTGSQAPAVRSAVMVSVVLVARALERQADALNALCLASLAMLALDPAGASDLSLGLSFLSVASLLVITPAFVALVTKERLFTEAPKTGWRGLRDTAFRAVRETFLASIAVVLTTLPWVVEAFGRVSLAGLVSNVVCLPIGAVLTLASAGGASVFLASSTLAVPILWAGTRLSWVFVKVAEAFATLPGASVEVPALGLFAGTVFLVGVFVWALAQGRLRWFALAVPLALAWAFWGRPAWQRLTAPELEVTFLSVGQGDAVFLSARGEHALVDGGGVPSGQVGARKVVPFLKHRGVRRLKFAALSHPHPDHALGLIETLESVSTDELWMASGTTEGGLSAAARKAAGPDARVRALSSGDEVPRLGNVAVRVLGPPPLASRPFEGVNDSSLVLELELGEVRVLLPGDLEHEGEAAVLDQVRPVTLLKAPHHGSKTSSTDALLAHARPRFAVFCVGRDNRFGFPHAEVANRYERLGSRCFRTDVSGAVTFRTDGHTVEVETFRPPSEGHRAPPPVPVAARTDNAQRRSACSPTTSTCKR